MGRYTFNLEGFDEVIFLKLVEQKTFGFTLSETLKTIMRDWIDTNHARLKEWGIDINQIRKELYDKFNETSGL